MESAAPRLSFEERVARLQRRRRVGQAAAALEYSLWLALTAGVGMLVFAGAFGLR